MGMGVKSRFSSHKAPKNSHLAPGQIKLRTEDLCSIRGELSQIKAQVDSLLESLEHMDQQRNKPAGIKDSEETHGAEGSTCRATEPQQEPRAQRAPPEHNSGEGTNVEETVKNHTRDW
ncbi:heterogeneous nuclear ribonucleoprotein C-like 2 isoform X2 [Dasypus novemcinctus]|uniref:heterogeneous nuclear ribonucleoprotein C-like 2 isoform X2 n=1 Tax=Dasypus novemcinctus TaxID=9361 RepID=UPI00265F0E84|nr:heterogeneous nuclear ribonucleoprotein C-like 2 isoform X3 [Dasypus novemcinctus]